MATIDRPIAALTGMLMASLVACSGYRISHPMSPFTKTGIYAYLLQDFSESRIVERIANYSSCIDKDDRKAARNEFIYGVMLLVDIEYEYATDLMHGTQTWGRATSDAVSVALDAAATLSTGAATRILAGLSGVTTATWSAYDRNLFAEKSASAIVTKMDAMRAVQRSRIDKALEADDSKYPLWRAMEDVADYFTMGSPIKAIDALISQANGDLESAQGR